MKRFRDMMNFATLEKMNSVAKAIDSVHKTYSTYRECESKLGDLTDAGDFSAEWSAAYDAERKATAKFKSAVKRVMKVLDVEKVYTTWGEVVSFKNTAFEAFMGYNDMVRSCGTAYNMLSSESREILKSVASLCGDIVLREV